MGDIHSLHVYIKLLRDALGGGSNANRYIEILWGKGYSLKQSLMRRICLILILATVFFGIGRGAIRG